MSRTIRYLKAAHVVAYTAIIASLIACSDSSDPSDPVGRPVATVAVTPTARELIVGRTATLTATAKDVDGNVIAGRAVGWATSNASVATVSAAGLVTAVAEGTVTVSATVDAKTGQADVTVLPVPAASVRLTPRTTALTPGATRQLTAVALDAGGNVLEGRTVEWSSDAPSVATVSATGVVQAVAPGYADIRATIEGKWSTTSVTVTTPEPAEQYDLVFERRAFNGLGEIRRLTPSSGVSLKIPLLAAFPGSYARDATPSPDGTRIAFTFAWYPEGSSQLDGEIYVASIDGTNMIRLTNSDGMDDQPVWSPDGTRIAFSSSHQNPMSDIYTMKPDGTGLVRLTNSVDSNWRPRWVRSSAAVVVAR